MRHLIIGHADDLCAQSVVHLLRERSHQVFTTFDPVAEQSLLSWVLDTKHSSSTVTFDNPSEVLVAETLQGVLVRSQGGPQTREGWTSEDWTYVQSERRAALAAWLLQLPCPVVNRPRADLWFRPQRPYAEWRTLFHQSGLPVLAVQVTNDFNRAKDFSKSCGGRVAYMPLTSNIRYVVNDDDDWRELAKLLKIFPVCLLESGSGHSDSAWLVGEEVFWTAGTQLEDATRVKFERGIRNLATCLTLATFEIEISPGTEGPCCSAINLYPRLENYAAETQPGIVSRITSLLGAHE